MRLVLFTGARPNIVKAAPLLRALEPDHKVYLVHTGQHYDRSMSTDIAVDVGLREPDHTLGYGEHGDRSQRLSFLIGQAGKFLNWVDLDAGIVLGDVDSTLACTLALKMNKIPVVHYEAGLRSDDMDQPEEINRRMVDHASDCLLATLEEGVLNLEKENVKGQVFHVGNVLADQVDATRDKLVPVDGEYALVTMHRPENVDSQYNRGRALEAIAEVAKLVDQVIVSVHPRFGRKKPTIANVHWEPPMGYIQFLSILASAKFVLTDSGGVQEEAAVLGTPCFTFRDNTERWATIEYGHNVLTGRITGNIHRIPAVLRLRNGQSRPIPLWDGRAAERCKSAIESWWKETRCTY